ncbi:acetylxylan esterase [Mucilaginibacter sp. dw_454]|uniref:acetylxylan esterase n=1 Tax=Mucilaginibacter sp. dw_454 TaxID=2720079 RepID=UPI001BD24DFC|nr:acetylxylan esterase [Mucilaginibacter sp. dw_454]
MAGMFAKLIFFIAAIILLNATVTFAQSKTNDKKLLADETEISTVITTTDKNAFFDADAKYTFEVKNPTNDDQSGKITYTVADENGVKMRTDSIKISVAKNSIGKYNFDIAGNGPGFYKVNFMINTNDYDDTLHQVFGVKPQLIKSSYRTPPDFDAFWQKAKDDLAKVDPKFKVTFMPKMSNKLCNVYLVQMQSLDNITIRGWLTEPVLDHPNKKLSVVLGLPGYQIGLNPIMTVGDPDFAFFTLNVRGQGNSREFINTRHDEFVVHNIDDKNKYVMRGVIMDCIRAMDFLYTRPEINHAHIFVKGGSMGGYLSITTAALDYRVNLCSAQSPVFADMRALVKRVKFPIQSINIYLKTQPGLTIDNIMDNFDYFDVKNFAPKVKCNFIMSVGLLDTYVPPTNDFAVYNSMTAKKQIMVFKDLGHDVSPLYTKLEQSWMHDQFGLY